MKLMDTLGCTGKRKRRQVPVELILQCGARTQHQECQVALRAPGIPEYDPELRARYEQAAAPSPTRGVRVIDLA